MYPETLDDLSVCGRVGETTCLRVGALKFSNFQIHNQIMSRGGRPRAPQFIVANTLPTDNLLQEIIRHRDLVLLSSETRDVVNWLARYRLLKNNMQCGVCHGPCSLTAYHQHVDGLRWKCRSCNFVKSCRDEFAWRWRKDTYHHGGGKAFQHILVTINEQFPM